MDQVPFQVGDTVSMPVDPSCYPFTVDPREDIPVVYDIPGANTSTNTPLKAENQKLVYTLILRVSYSPPQLQSPPYPSGKNPPKTSQR